MDSRMSSISANFYQYSNSWIFIPEGMSAEISDDGKVWTKWGKSISNVDLKQRGKFIQGSLWLNKEQVAIMNGTHGLNNFKTRCISMYTVQLIIQ